MEDKQIPEINKLLAAILELARRMVHAGAEVWLVEQRIRQIIYAYGFKSCDLKIMTSYVEATVQTQDDRVRTQIREVKNKRYDMDKLIRLSALSKNILETTPDYKTILSELSKITRGPVYSRGVIYAASAIGTACFTMFYNGYRQDVALVALFTLLGAFLKEHLGRNESNLLVYNTLLAYIMELLVVGSMMAGAGRSLSAMTAGVILFLVSGIGITSGMRDLLHENTLSGVTDFMNALLGAMGISIGISLALMTFGEELLKHLQGQAIVENQLVQLIGSVGGCVGFAILFNCRKRVLLFSGIGAAITWETYLLTLELTDGNYFEATLAAACAAAIFANGVSMFIKTPPTVFLTTCILPIVPGSTLYLVVYSIIMDDRISFHANGRKLFLVCVAIALGYIIVEVVFKYARQFRNKAGANDYRQQDQEDKRK